MNKPLSAVILAGGIGKRFWPVSQDKNLVSFLGKPFIRFNVLESIPAEVDNIVVIANSKNYEYLKNYKYNRPVQIIIQENAQGMADAILRAENQLKNSSLLIYISSNFTGKNLFSEVLNIAKSTNCYGVIPATYTDHYVPMGYLEVDNDRVTAIAEKPGPGLEPSKLVNITGHYINNSNELISQMKKVKSGKDDVYEKALTILMQKYDFRYYIYSDYSIPFKYPWQILDVMAKSFEGLQKPEISKSVQIHKNVYIEGPVVIEDNVRIFENTKIIGPAYIGKNSIIGNNNMIRQTQIGEDCVTGFNTEITRSYIGSNCWFHNSYIGDSVIDANVSFGGGTTLANLRLDEGNIKSAIGSESVSTDRDKFGAVIGTGTRIGVNVSIMPGKKIGRGVFVGAGVIVDKDIDDDMFYILKQQYNIFKNNHKAVSVSREKFKKVLK